MPPISNAEAQRRWRERQNAYAAIGRAELSGPAKSKRARLEAEHLRVATLWSKQLAMLADVRAYFDRLKDAPRGEWASNERAETLERMHFHESTARAFDTLLKSYERELKTFEKYEETMAESRRHLAGHRGRS